MTLIDSQVAEDIETVDKDRISLFIFMNDMPIDSLKIVFTFAERFLCFRDEKDYHIVLNHRPFSSTKSMNGVFIAIRLL